MRSTSLVIVGVGDVVINRYVAALLSLQESISISVSAFLDITVSEQKREFLGKHFPNAEVHQLRSGTSDEVCEFLGRFSPDNTIVILATPPNCHVDVACKLLTRGYFVAIEKPMASSLKDLVFLQTFLNHHGTRRLFLFSYYALEKGLPLFLLSGVEGIPEKAYHLTSPSYSPAQWSGFKAKLGRVIEIRGALLEGVGAAGTLSHRPWVLQGDLGGNTVETFYHLVTLSLPFLPVVGLSLSNHTVTLGWSNEVLANGTPKDKLGETLTLMSAFSGEVRVRLACAKYVSQSADQRWMEVLFENGSATMDFLTGQLRLQLSGSTYAVMLSSNVKYETQFQLLFEANDRDVDCRLFSFFSKSLGVTFDIRNAGLHSGEKRLEYSRLDTYLFDFLK